MCILMMSASRLMACVMCDGRGVRHVAEVVTCALSEQCVACRCGFISTGRAAFCGRAQLTSKVRSPACARPHRWYIHNVCMCAAACAEVCVRVWIQAHIRGVVLSCCSEAGHMYVCVHVQLFR